MLRYGHDSRKGKVDAGAAAVWGCGLGVGGLCWVCGLRFAVYGLGFGVWVLGVGGWSLV
jgi:hypothetical protein